MKTETERKLMKKSERMRVKSQELLAKANEAHNKANDIRIDNALRSRLPSDHYQLITSLSYEDLVEFRIAPDHYLIAIEDRKVYLRLIKREQITGVNGKSLQGTSYPIRSLIGYYSGFETPETTRRTDFGDLVLINPSLSDPERRVCGMIDVPLEAIVSYEIIRKNEKGK